MKRILKYINGLCLLSLCASPHFAHAQSFTNLNFESATLSPTVGPEPSSGRNVPIASGLPGWTAYLGSVQQTQVSQNTYTGGTAAIDILGPNWQIQGGPSGPVGIIDGNYTVFLQTGVGPPDYTGGINASIAQMGTVPGNAQSLQFYTADQGNNLSVSFAGNNLTAVALSSAVAPSGEPYTVYGVDIAPYAGLTGELEFTEVFNEHFPSADLDDISFSTTPIPTPEPEISVLVAIGGLFFGARKRFARRRIIPPFPTS